MSLDYVIVVPSRKRVANMTTIRKLLPTAFVTVDEAELEDYAAVVPRELLVAHPKARTMGHLRNMILEQFAGDAVVMVDDDFNGMRCMVGKRPREVDDPAAIQRVFENSIQVCSDLGLGAFCYHRDPRPYMFDGCKPFKFIVPAMGAFGAVGDGMKLKFDPDLSDGEDLDWTMKHLLKERIVWCDTRFYFEFGAVWKGQGGQQGVRTDERVLSSRRMVQRRWGRYIAMDDAKKMGGLSCGFRLERRSDLVTLR